MRRRRFLAGILAVFMALSLLPASALAAAPVLLEGKLAVSGVAAEGSTLSADFKNVTPENIPEDGVTFLWSRRAVEDESAEQYDEASEPEELSTEKTYTVTSEDIGSKIVLTITGAESMGFSGSLEAVTSEILSKEEAAALLEASDSAYAEDYSEETEETEGTEETEETDQDDTWTEEEIPAAVSDMETEEYAAQDTDALYEENENVGTMETDSSEEETEQAGTESIGGIPVATEDGSLETQAAEEADENIDSSGDTADAAFVLSVVGGSASDVMDFGTVNAGEEGETESYITITNTGTADLYFDSVSPEHFGVKDVESPLATGETVTLAVWVRAAETAGTYEETITYSAWDADYQTNIQQSFKASVTIAEAEQPAVSAVAADKTAVDFGSLTENYETAEAQTVTLTNSGSAAAQISVESQNAEGQNYFDAVLSEAAIPSAEEGTNTATLTITPKTGLPAAEVPYTETFDVTDSNSGTSIAVTASVTVQEEPEEIHKLTISALTLDFGSTKKGYGEIEAQQVTVYNEGNVAETLVQPAGTNFEVSTVDAAYLTLQPDASISFTVRPKTGLAVGTYSETIDVASASAAVSFTASFTVTKSTVSVIKINNPADITGLANATKKDASSLKLPSTVVIETEGGNKNAQVTWNLKNCSYDADSVDAQTFTVSGTVTLPDGVDNDGKLELTAKVNVSVKAYSPKLASADDNEITGITYNGSYTTQSRITFTAVGAGMDNTDPREGDTRYIPANWKALTETSFNDSTYTGNFGISEAGNYTLTVTFRQQQYDGAKWAETGKTDTKQVPFVITKATATVTNPGLDITPAANKRSAVQTGDDTPIVPFVIILVAAAAVIGGVVFYRKKK